MAGMARKDDEDTSSSTRSTTTSTTSTAPTASSTMSATGTGAGEAPAGNAGDPSEVTFTPATTEGGRTTADASTYSDSKMVQNGEWRPETHGMPPDQRPNTGF